jgi:hypothetical protein
VIFEPGKFIFGQVIYIAQVVIRGLVEGIQDRGWPAGSSTPERPAVIVVVHLLDRPAAVMAVKAEIIRFLIGTCIDRGIKVLRKNGKGRCIS